MEYQINIDRLEISYNLDNEIINRLNEDYIEFDCFHLIKSNEDSNYKIKYEIWVDEFEDNQVKRILFGHIYFGSYRKFKKNLYISVANNIFYRDNTITDIYYIEQALNLKFIGVNKLDIALDVNKNIIDRFYEIYKDVKYIPIIFKKRYKNRNVDIKQVINITNGSRKNPHKNKSIYLKNKEGGLTLALYNKFKEITDNNSEKSYIIENWKHNKLFRLEIRTSGHILKDTLTNLGISNEELYYRIFNKDILFNIYQNLLNRIIRIEYKNKCYNILNYLL